MTSAEVLVLHGSPGSGKTTIARAVAERLCVLDLANAVIDLDELAIVYPEQGGSFSRGNLRSVWPNYAAVPSVRVILPLVVRDHDDLSELREITAPARFMVCELTAPRAILERRVVEREPDDHWRSRLLDFVALYHGRDDHSAIRDFAVATHPQPVEDTAVEVIGKCGWS